jgi:predicted hydrocarbon binding protein
VKEVLEGRMTDNLVMKLTLDTVQRELGKKTLDNILHTSNLDMYIDNFPPDNDDLVIPLDHLHRIQLALFELLGYRSSRGLMILIGKKIARHGIESRSSLTNALRLSVKVLPESKKIGMLLKFLVKQAEERYTIDIQPAAEVKEEDDYFLFIHKQWHTSEGISTEQPVCHDLVGMIQYLVKWITGSNHHIEEIRCRAMGHAADVIRIAKRSE